MREATVRKTERQYVYQNPKNIYKRKRIRKTKKKKEAKKKK